MKHWNEAGLAVGDEIVTAKGDVGVVKWVSHNAITFSVTKKTVCEAKERDNVRLAVALSKVA